MQTRDVSQGKYADAIAALWLLIERYPACFYMLDIKRRALEIGIYDKIVAANVIEPGKLKLALQFYCRSEGYLRAMARGGARIGLAGEPVGVVSPPHAADAAKGLAARLARKQASQGGGAAGVLRRWWISVGEAEALRTRRFAGGGSGQEGGDSMIENLTKEQMAGVAAAWRGLSDLPAEDRHTEAFSDGRKWGIAHSFDASLAVIEFFCWWMACNEDAKLERSVDYFHQVMLAEIGET